MVNNGLDGILTCLKDKPVLGLAVCGIMAALVVLAPAIAGIVILAIALYVIFIE